MEMTFILKLDSCNTYKMPSISIFLFIFLLFHTGNFFCLVPSVVEETSNLIAHRVLTSGGVVESGMEMEHHSLHHLVQFYRFIGRFDVYLPLMCEAIHQFGKSDRMVADLNVERKVLNKTHPLVSNIIIIIIIIIIILLFNHRFT